MEQPGTSFKECVKNLISDYAVLDNEIQLIKQELKKRMNTKKDITSRLVVLMESSNVECFETGSSSVVYKKKKSRQVISRKYLKGVLDDTIDDPDYANRLLETIMENRAVKLTDVIQYKDN